MAPSPVRWQKLKRVALIGTYLPRRCGIATFTSDVFRSLNETYPELDTWVVAMNDRPEGYHYPPAVKFEINDKRAVDYRLAAEFLNMSEVDLVCIQHEYGIFGGKEGRMILDLIKRLHIPVAVTLHTVLKEPHDAIRDVTQELAELADVLVVLSHRGEEFLRDNYGIPAEKIAMIPHGIPDLPFVDPNFYKDQFDVAGKNVILTFGLLGPSKGIEHMIDAMPAIVEKHPDTVYVVLGATHPGVLADQGENYRNSLTKRTEDLGVADNVIFVNKFVEMEELCEFLGAADVYVSPYPNEAQIVSGTLAYALGSGNALVSTPYWYAQEMLDEGRGKLVPIGDSEAMAKAVTHLFDNELERHAIRKRAYNFTREMVWPAVAEKYLDLFEEMTKRRHRSPRPVRPDRPTLRQMDFELPEIKIDHLRILTDDTGVLRFCKGSVPDRAHGYATADNARALAAVMLAKDHMKSGAGCTDLATQYLSFLDHSFDQESLGFHETMTYDRRWSEQRGSEECHATSLWGLGVAVARSQVVGQLTVGLNLFHDALPAAEEFQSPRAWAYTLLAIQEYLRRFSGDSEARRMRQTIAHRMLNRFDENQDDDWRWPENTLTYDNARLPHALLMSGRWLFNSEMIETALNSLDWLYNIEVSENGHFMPIGNDGWYPRGGVRSRFNQSPIEACAMLEACLEAYRVTQSSHWIHRAQTCLNWFRGFNDMQVPLYDNATGGCHDCLHPAGVNENMGARPTLSWLLALLAMYDHEAEMAAATDERAAQPAMPEVVEKKLPESIKAALAARQDKKEEEAASEPASAK